MRPFLLITSGLKIINTFRQLKNILRVYISKKPNIEL
jgi:hypothetical protein